ncbi:MULTISPECIES: SSI family serine proteinase inhibitor [Paenarthrobacter]|uniref:Subtilase-type protease inhibitor n=2 Tax=Paenarthrobacter TaxID=1742992 RepID=A0AAX3EJQ7_PAEUR|nr:MULTISPECIES: SSI family serine proteinase inhibitor [Paenarthrobacter]NKR11852.1 serine protease inhibitor [Arthrobacter sp. M5]NKR15584.1 serine protease inhibitor [Arthrobacter sp. M6]OEH58570.1 serine protease inhibitor [Arthrobacter sp. D4]OEH64858.1 serine protease inhibitor [Arthrobacter sp. D2]MDO5863230.1 subtilase-type protease inhibitor [Paenarthrobacter sp. SD-2]
MRMRFVRSALAVLTVAGLAACTGGPAPDATSSSSATSSSATSSSSPAPSSSATTGATPTQVPTTLGPGDTSPNPSLPATTPTPGQGNAELSITFLASPDAAPKNYTLVCQGGVPAAESNHPTAAAACEVLKNYPALLNPAPVKTDQACTMQFGGPETATVTGAVDGTEVDAKFSRTDGCQIALWDAAGSILGASGGAA